jgi:hypothetical protein
MKTEILNTENLAGLHEQLNDFAKHHQNKGGQEAHKLVKSIWDESKVSPRDGSPDRLKHDEGFDAAFKYILSELHKRFVP